MRACVIGGGLAGSLLAWRLAQETTGWQLDLVLGERRRADATAASGGAVRAYETDAEQRRLATVSMVELLDSPTLREWAGYRRVDSLYLRRGSDGLEAAVADIESMLPGSVELVAAAELERRGWADLQPGCAAVLERAAGYTSPDRFREALLADGVKRPRVSMIEDAVGSITPRDNGTVACGVAGQDREYDLVVMAVGAWTSALLAANGLPADGYRTKSIQYSVYRVDESCPSEFVDEFTGLFGRPTADGGLLLGLPTHDWDVDPDRPPTTPALHDTAARLARERFPRLRIGPATLRVGSADCYSDHRMLCLRSVVDTDHQLFTFSGGAGGSVKTALAASHQAARQLIESDHPNQLTPVGSRNGQK